MGGLIPYLNFDGKCYEALSFYQQTLGGEVGAMRVKEMPEMAAQMPPEMADKVLHGDLRSGKLVMYASDLSREPLRDGNSIQLCINCDSAEELHKLFNGLGAGGEVLEAVDEKPWGALYGEIRDKYGKTWIFNYQHEPM